MSENKFIRQAPLFGGKPLARGRNRLLMPEANDLATVAESFRRELAPTIYY